MESVDVAVIGAGPAGLSAAARCARRGLSCVLFESSPAIAKTIQDYQKGKHVMAEPGFLPLRAELEFAAGKREQILDAWMRGAEELGLVIRYSADVSAISGAKGAFEIRLRDGQTLKAAHVVLAMGVQGNPRQLGIPGDDHPAVQYTLPDAKAIRGESVVVVGAGDAAIENAVSLAGQNKVTIINRRDEFARAKEGNLQLVSDAIESGKLRCLFATSPVRLESEESGSLRFVVKTREGETELGCDRIIARLGAIPPRGFLDAIGIRFPNNNPNAIPILSSRYESSVPGLFVIGALAGCPLIKQAMNQGYEVIEHIVGEPVLPVDHQLLADRLACLPFGLNVDETLALLQRRIPMFGALTALQFRELMLESTVISSLGGTKGNSSAGGVRQGDALFRKGDYTNSFFTVVDGEAWVLLDDAGQRKVVLRGGQFFGEMSLLAGQRRSATAVAGPGCVLIETPRRTMVKLLNSNDDLRRGLDEIFIMRALQSNFAPDVPFETLGPIAAKCELRSFSRGDRLFSEGEQGKEMFFVRTGSVLLSRGSEQGREIVFSQVPSGQYLGEMSLMGNPVRSASAMASVYTETIVISEQSFRALIKVAPALITQIQQRTKRRIEDNANVESSQKSSGILSFLMDEGLSEATDALIIDEDLCVGCDNCEVACAETHGGLSRLDRSAGPSFASVHIPIACRHCELPHCMKDCPPDAIHRSSSGEVFIDQTCIGCGNCERNCPYSVIKMAYPAPPKSGLFSWLLFGLGQGPGQHHDSSKSSNPDAQKKAVKCDACKDLSGGPACVRACPTGAAVRLAPSQFNQLIAQRMKGD